MAPILACHNILILYRYWPIPGEPWMPNHGIVLPKIPPER